MFMHNGGYARGCQTALFALALFAMLSVTAYAHSPLMVIEDNDDGTFTVTAGFTNGQMATGKKILLKSTADGTVLWENTLDENGELVCPKQAEPYIVYFDGGPGHSMKENGIMPKAGEKAPAATSSSGNSGIETTGADAMTGATQPGKKIGGNKGAAEPASGDDPAYPRWDLPLSTDFTEDIKLKLLSESISLKNSLGLARKTSLMQCYQYHGQIELGSVIGMVENRREAGKKVDFHARPVSICLGVTSGYLAMDFAARKLYGKETPVMEDFRIGTEAEMDGIWDAFELILGSRLSRDCAVKKPSPEAFVFTAERPSDGKKIVFTYSDDFKKRLVRFFEGKNNPDRVPEKEFQNIRKDILAELINRHASGDYGYFVILEDTGGKANPAAKAKQTVNAKKGSGKPLVLSEWNMPAPTVLGDPKLHARLESIDITTKNCLGMVRRINLIQCNQFHTRPDIESLLASVRKQKEAVEEVAAESSEGGGMCLGMVAGYLASHYAIKAMYGDGIPDIDDFTLGSNCPMAGLWDSLNLVCARDLVRGDPASAPTRGAFSFTITRASDGRVLTFTFTKAYQEKFERFFDMKWHPEKYRDTENQIRQLQEEMIRSLLTRFAEGDYGYFTGASRHAALPAGLPEGGRFA
jgi:hypothetical protein